jgi:Cu2+-exporting ATPase
MRQGIEVIMLTEIIKNTAKAVADELHLTSFIAGLSEDKPKKFKDCKQKGNCCHGGINDAPALAPR